MRATAAKGLLLLLLAAGHPHAEAASASAAQAGHGPSIPEADFEKLLKRFRPQPKERLWTQIPWIADSIQEARRRAAAEGKPIFLFTCVNHPLGYCHGKARDVREGFLTASEKARKILSERCIPFACDLGQFRFDGTADIAWIQKAMEGAGGVVTILVTVDGKSLTPNYWDKGIGGKWVEEGLAKTLEEGLARFAALPESERKPKGLKEWDVDPREKIPKLPEGGLALKVHAQGFEKDAGGEYKLASWNGGENSLEPLLNYLWLTAAEVQGLVPKETRKGAKFDAPVSVADRLYRLYMHDFRRKMRPYRKGEVSARSLTVTVEEASSTEIRLRLAGSAKMAAPEEGPWSPVHRTEATLAGRLIYDLKKKGFTRFDLVGLSDHWHENHLAGTGAPGGTITMGMSVEPTRPGTFEDRVVPQYLFWSEPEVGVHRSNLESYW